VGRRGNHHQVRAGAIEAMLEAIGVLETTESRERSPGIDPRP
jgi:hypothetical protein